MTTASPFFMTPDAMTAAWQDFTRKMAAMPKVAQAARRVRVGVTPSRPIYREDSMRVLNYETAAELRFETPVLVVFALVNRPYILDLRDGKSVVSHFVNHGFDTYKIDWGVPVDGDRDLSLEDYVLRRYMDNAVDALRERTGCEQINLLGYCMGGSMSAMYTALRPEKIRNLIMLAAPVDWSPNDSLLGLWTREEYFNVDRMIEVYGNAAHWLQSSFLMLKPVQNLFEKYINFYENMENEKFLEDFFAMETWLNDNIPVAGETFRQFVKYLFQQNQLIQGKLRIGDERVDLKNIRCPVLNLIAQHDHLVVPAQSLPLRDAVGSTDVRTIEFPAGHIGMAVGGKAHRDLWPAACEWLAQRSEPRHE